MLEKEFAQRYNTSQKNTHAPADLVEATRVLMAYAREDEVASVDDAPGSSLSSGTGGAPRSRPSVREWQKRARRTQRHRWMIPVAACLAALLVLFGVGSAVLPTGLPFVQEQAPVRAYAKTPNLLTAELGDGIVPFAMDVQAHTGNWTENSNTEGSYTGMLFSVEGEDIASVQATISRGELYRVTTGIYDDTTEEGRAILEEAASWKPTARGTGEYLRDYDYVNTYVLPQNDSDTVGPNKRTQLRFLKRYGSTIDVPYEGEPLTFGLWFGDVGLLANGLLNIYDLDGTELTLTATYTNGTFRTQTMTLHDGWFKVLPSGPDEVMAEGPLTDQELKQKYDPNKIVRKTVHTLYGEVTSITDQPHPYSLDTANERADTAVEAYPLFDPYFTPSTGTFTLEGLPTATRIRPLDGDFAIGQWSYERSDWADLRWSEISAYITDTLPTSIDLYRNTEVWGFQGNITYMNRCRMQTNHWTVDEEGRVNSANSFVVLDVTVTNAEDEEVMFSGRDVRGTMCAVSEETGKTLFADGGLFGAADELGRTWGHGSEDSFTLGPHESLCLHMAFIADNAIAEADEVLFTITNRYEFEPYHGRALVSIDEAEFISLGKLERR